MLVRLYYSRLGIISLDTQLTNRLVHLEDISPQTTHPFDVPKPVATPRVILHAFAYDVYFLGSIIL